MSGDPAGCDPAGRGTGQGSDRALGSRFQREPHGCDSTANDRDHADEVQRQHAAVTDEPQHVTLFPLFGDLDQIVPGMDDTANVREARDQVLH